MRDTPGEVDHVFRAMLLGRSSEERLRMGCSMYAFRAAGSTGHRSGAAPLPIKQNWAKRLMQNPGPAGSLGNGWVARGAGGG
ncbi:MAG: hypothetical protein Q8Q58_02520, partial [Candidatus Rokubacteria bacterium]|nr:hypothetical protein [Candidatus Rokubacteria bacterium]